MRGVVSEKIKTKNLQTRFSAFIETRRLARFTDDKNLLPAFASSSAEVFPYQIAAARFALRVPYLKGCILCDEGSLGKTYEALLIAAQKWYEGREKILVVLPQNLIPQWVSKLEKDFTLPYFLWDKSDELPNADGLAIVTYDFAIKNTDAIEEISWDLVIFDEADFLFKPQNKSVIALKNATKNSFKLLLTPTPITLSIMDIYGLIHFIDESVLPDETSFYKRYFRKPENYGELTNWVSGFCFRTLKRQVTQYVNFSKRVPITVDYSLLEKEKDLYKLVDNYILLPYKTAYPQMDKYDLTLMFYHTLSSSTQAFYNMLNAPVERAEGTEKELLIEVQNLAKSIEINSKTNKLLDVLKPVFACLKEQKLNQKAVIFVDNLTTLDVLYEIFVQNGYNALKYKNNNTLEKFRNDTNVEVLITTDTAAKGLDIEYCPVVVNYDLLYNAIEMEQRICRCHRQGQKSDVLVINMLSKENFADVRILELINKRVLQFSGIFGMSDDIVGHFDSSISDALKEIRHREEVTTGFEENLKIHKTENEQIVSHAEDVLFTTFTKSVAETVNISPKYIQDKIDEINNDLWTATKYFFANRNDYVIDENYKIITCKEQTSPMLFYYWAGDRNKPYHGEKQYGLGKGFNLRHARISFTSILSKGIFNEVKCPDYGELQVNAKIEPCEIGFYKVDIKSKTNWITSFDILVGRTKSGQILSDEQCRGLMNLHVLNCKESEHIASYGLRCCTENQSYHELDGFVPEKELIQKYIDDRSSFVAEEIERIKLRASRKKAVLETSLHDLRTQIKDLSKDTCSGDKLKELQTQKQVKVLEKELRQKEGELFLAQMKIGVAMEDEIQNISQPEKFSTTSKRMFVVRLTGKAN